MLATQILEVWFSEMLATTISRHVDIFVTFRITGKFKIPELLAIIFVRNAGHTCYNLIIVFEMATNVNTCKFQNC